MMYRFLNRTFHRLCVGVLVCASPVLCGAGTPTAEEEVQKKMAPLGGGGPGRRAPAPDPSAAGGPMGMTYMPLLPSVFLKLNGVRVSAPPACGEVSGMEKPLYDAFLDAVYKPLNKIPESDFPLNEHTHPKSITLTGGSNKFVDGRYMFSTGGTAIFDTVSLLKSHGGGFFITGQEINFKQRLFMTFEKPPFLMGNAEKASVVDANGGGMGFDIGDMFGVNNCVVLQKPESMAGNLKAVVFIPDPNCEFLSFEGKIKFGEDGVYTSGEHDLIVCGASGLAFVYGSQESGWTFKDFQPDAKGDHPLFMTAPGLDVPPVMPDGRKYTEGKFTFSFDKKNGATVTNESTGVTKQIPLKKKTRRALPPSS